jgi:hypothetical protein
MLVNKLNSPDPTFSTIVRNVRFDRFGWRFQLLLLFCQIVTKLVDNYILFLKLLIAVLLFDF